MIIEPDAPGVLHLSPEGMREIEAALDAEPRVIPELVDAIRKARARYGERGASRTTP